MAKWSTTRSKFTLTAVADTTNYTDGAYHALQGGASAQRIKVTQLSISGLDSASSTSTNCELIFALDSTLGATSLSGATTRQFAPATAALAAPPTAFSASTTKPQRSSSAYLLLPAINSFGGVYLWNADPDDPIEILGNATTTQSEISLSAKSGAGIISSHIIFEPL